MFARQHSYVDQSPLVARRLGFSALPLAVLTILIGAQSLGLMLSRPMLPRFIFDIFDAVGSGAWWELGWWQAAVQDLANTGIDVDWEALGQQAKWSIVGVSMWMWQVIPALYP